MKGYYRHILLASAVIMAAAACTKHTEYDTPETDNIIQLSATESGTTKALLNNGSFSATGNRIKVYDYVTSDGGTSKYLDTYAGPDVTSSSPLHVPGTTWPFTDEIDGTEADVKQWTPGTHKFFGWLAKDVSSGMDLTPEGLFGDSFSFDDETQTLTIPSTTMTASTPQFDFMYSNIFTTEPINEPVDLEFSHLFTAFSIGVLNTSNLSINLKSFTLDPIRNTNSATITWPTGETADGQYPASVAYGEGSLGTAPFMALSDPYSIATNAKLGNIFTGGAQVFYLMWPQASEDVHSAELITEDPDSKENIYPESYKMSVTYTETGEGGESEEINKRLNFPDLDWEAGKKYHFDVVFSDKMVELKAVVNPWNYEYSDVDFSDAMVSVKENHYLIWDGTTADLNTTDRYAIIRNGQPVKGTFTLDTPQGGTWLVSLTGDLDAFEVSPASGTIDGTPATIVVKPLVGDPQRDYTVNVKFAVRRPDGRVIAADDVVQPEGTKYTIVLPSNK